MVPDLLADQPAGAAGKQRRAPGEPGEVPGAIRRWSC